MTIAKFHLMVRQRKIWAPISYGYWFLEVTPGPPRAGLGPSKIFFGPPWKGGPARGQVRNRNRECREQDGCWPQVPLTRQSPRNYIWYYRKRHKQIQNIRALGSFPKRRAPVILMIQHDETTWYGVLVTIIMRQISSQTGEARGFALRSKTRSHVDTYLSIASLWLHCNRKVKLGRTSLKMHYISDSRNQ